MEAHERKKREAERKAREKQEEIAAEREAEKKETKAYEEAKEQAEQAEAKEPAWEEMEGYVPPGTEGFGEFARAQMRAAGVPSNSRVLPADELKPAERAGQPTKPKLQPYQETVSFVARPTAYNCARLLVGAIWVLISCQVNSLIHGTTLKCANAARVTYIYRPSPLASK